MHAQGSDAKVDNAREMDSPAMWLNFPQLSIIYRGHVSATFKDRGTIPGHSQQLSPAGDTRNNRSRPFSIWLSDLGLRFPPKK